jgi:NCAIR mutase (PurE)-related protein
MKEKEIKNLLEDVKNQVQSVDEAVNILKNLPFEDVQDFAKIDNHREIRVGYPEVIYCEGKSIDHVVQIFEYMHSQGNNVLGTRASKEMFDAVEKIVPSAVYNPMGRTITDIQKPIEMTSSYIALVSAGTSDIRVIEEAKETALILGNQVKIINDVGVSGIHRLFNHLEDIRNAKVVIVAAGMEGALASVVGGLVDKPVIAVPTSIGYGANFGGLSALLSMLNSCASGVTVVNIDNGFGAAYSASIINHL